MNLRFGLFISTLLAGSANGRLTGEEDVGAKEVMPPPTLGNEAYTGTWAMVNTIGPNLGMGILLFTCVDGTCEGVQRINVPSTFTGGEPGGRFTIPPLPFPAELDIGPDGRGTFLFTFPESLGGSGPFDWIISPERRQGNLVTAFNGSPQFLNPGLAPNGQTSLISATRRAADGYSNQSLNGVYAWSSAAGLNQGAYYGFATFDGEGGFTGVLTSDEPDPEGVQGRDTTEGPLLGTYEVADNGLVTMTQTGSGAPMDSLFFIVTEGAPGRVAALRGLWDSAPTSQFIDSSAATVVDLSYYEPATSNVPLGDEAYTGTWAMVNTIGPNLGMGILLITCVDGTCEGVQRLNLPSTFTGGEPGGRFTLPPLPFPAELDIGPDGRGTFLYTFPESLGGSGPFDWIISPERRQGNLVTAFNGSPQFLNPGLAPNGQTSLISATRRAADGYSNQSLNGVYAWSSAAGLNQGAYYGFATFNGEGGFTGILTSDEPDPEGVQGRDTTEGPLLGTYEVADNGLVTMTQTGSGAPMDSLFFIVTEGPPGRAVALRGLWDSAPTSQFIDSSAATVVDLSYYEPGTSNVPALRASSFKGGKSVSFKGVAEME